MAARRSNQPIHPYDARTLRATVASLPLPGQWADRHVSAPVVVNPSQPVVVPEVARAGQRQLVMDVPFDIRLRPNGRLAKPLAMETLEAAIGLQRRKIDLFVKVLGLGDSAYAALRLSRVDGAAEKASSRSLGRIGKCLGAPTFSKSEFNRSCRESASRIAAVRSSGEQAGTDSAETGNPSALRGARPSPHGRIGQNSGRNRSSYEPRLGFDSLDQEAQLLLTRNADARTSLIAALSDFRAIKQGFGIVVRGVVRDGKALSLNGLHNPFRHLPQRTVFADLLDVSFFGMINAATIYVNRAAVSDLFDVAAALGKANVGVLRVDALVARTFLADVMHEGKPAMQVDDLLRPDRAELATMMVERYGLSPYVDAIARVCRHVEATGEPYECVGRLWDMV